MELSVKRLSRKRLIFFLPAALYFLWLAGTDWLNHFFTLANAGSGPIALNYIQFYLFHAAGIAGAAAILRKSGRSSTMRVILFSSILATCIFTFLMPVSKGILFNIVIDAAGLCAGLLPALLSHYALTQLSPSERGAALGRACGTGYLLHFLLFVLAFPGQEGPALRLKSCLAMCAMLCAGLSILFLCARGKRLWDADVGVAPPDGEKTKNRRLPVFSLLFALLLLFSLAYSAQSHAATAAWLNHGVFALPYARIFLVLGLFAGGILCDRASRFFVLSLSFGLLAAGLPAALLNYTGTAGFLLFSCAQFAEGLFFVFAWYIFLNAAMFFKSPGPLSALSLAFLTLLKQAGYLLMYAVVSSAGELAAFWFLLVGNLIVIGAAFPLSSRLVYAIGDMFVSGAREGLFRPAQNTQKDAPATVEAAAEQLPLNDLYGFRYQYGLSERGVQVLSLALNGFSIAEIAQNLGITERTVKYHISQNLQKTNVKNNRQLIALAVKSLQNGQKPVDFSGL